MDRSAKYSVLLLFIVSKLMCLLFPEKRILLSPPPHSFPSRSTSTAACQLETLIFICDALRPSLIGQRLRIPTTTPATQTTTSSDTLPLPTSQNSVVIHKSLAANRKSPSVFAGSRDLPRVGQTCRHSERVWKKKKCQCQNF